MTRKLGLYCAFIISLLAFAAPASATISFSTGGLAGTGVTADVGMTYQSISDTASRLTISITNTTLLSVGGFVTGFAFNLPSLHGVNFTSIGGDIDDAGKQQTTELTTANVNPGDTGWWTRFDYEGIKAPNGAGRFDFGVLNHSTANAFINGGNGKPPYILEGDTTDFFLDITGTGLDDFSSASFESAIFNELSTSGSAGAFNFGVRFQGVGPDDQNSDLATMTVVPVPSALALGLIGLASVSWVRRRANNIA